MYMVMIVRNWYANQIGVNHGPDAIRDHDGRIDDPVLYDTMEDAQEAIEDIEDGDYVLANGEAGRPEYYIVDADKGQWVLDGRGEDGSNYDWSGVVCDSPDKDGNQCGNCDACIAAQAGQDCDYVRRNAVKVA